MSGQEELAVKILGFVQAKARSNAAFKTGLLENANEALAAEGITVPAGVTVRFVEDTPTVWHFVLPAGPGDGEMTDEDLNKVAGGFSAQLGITKQMGGPKQLGVTPKQMGGFE